MPSGIPFAIADSADLVNVSIQDIWLKSADQETREFEQFMNVETGITDYYVKDSSLTGLGLAGRVVENAAITAVSPVQGYDKTYTQVQFGILLSITKPMWFFGIKKRQLTQITQETRKACNSLREVRCVERLENVGSTSYTANDISGNYSVTTTGGDGLAFASASHTREDGGANWSNVVTDGTTSNMDWEYDALKAAHRTATREVDPVGMPLGVRLDTFVCPLGYANYHRAVEMLGAINKGWMPASAEKEGPGVGSFKIVALSYWDDNTSYWQMFDSRFKSQKYGFQFKESQPIELEGPNIVFRTGEIQYKATMMFDLGHNDPRGWVCSDNTNS